MSDSNEPKVRHYPPNSMGTLCACDDNENVPPGGGSVHIWNRVWSMHRWHSVWLPILHRRRLRTTHPRPPPID